MAPVGKPRRLGTMCRVTLDIERVRASFPALTGSSADDVSYFDGPGGSQTPREVADAVAGAMTAGLANRYVITAAERRAEDIVQGARSAVADLLGVRGRGGLRPVDDPGDLRHGAHPGQGLGVGDEVIVTRLDHDSNIRPWVQAAESRRCHGPVGRLRPRDRRAPGRRVTALLTERTRLVAVTAASNLLGTRPRHPGHHRGGARRRGAVVRRGVHLTPHASVDVAALGADFYACSPYKFFGPHHGLVVADPDLLHTLEPDKLLPQTDAVPERFELGTLPYELLAGTTAAVDFIAGLASSAATRRDRVVESMAAVEEHEDGCSPRCSPGCATSSGSGCTASPARRTPTVLVLGRGHRAPTRSTASWPLAG